MDVEFDDDDLERLEKDASHNCGHAAAIVHAFQKLLRLIRSAADERDFRAMRSLNFEKLKGDRAHQHSMRLNKQWRLVIELKPGTPKNIVVVIAIEDYH